MTSKSMKLSGDWELVAQPYEPGFLLRLTMKNGHVAVFPLTGNHPIVIGLFSANKMDKYEPAP